jgi:Flp pilus assembly protein TadB
MLFLLLFSPDFLSPLFHNLIGQVFAIGAVVMMILGFLIIRKIVRIEL